MRIFLVIVLAGCDTIAPSGVDLGSDLAQAADDLAQAANDLAQATSDLAQAPPDLAPAGGSVGGAIAGWPTTVTMPSLQASALDVLTIFFSDDQGGTFYSDYFECARVYGQSATNPTFRALDGKIELLQNWCTSKANRWQIASRPGMQRFKGKTQYPVVVSNAVFDIAALPSLSVYWSRDNGVSWFSQYQECAGGDSFSITDGKLTLPSTYCTGAATDYQIVVRPGTRRLSGNFTTPPIVLSDGAFATARLANISVYWSSDGARWWSEYGECAGGRPFVISDGRLQLNSTYCTSGAQKYQVVIDDG